jgi:hypothetical protein
MPFIHRRTETFFNISQKSEKSFSSFAHDILFFFSWICKRFFSFHFHVFLFNDSMFSLVRSHTNFFFRFYWKAGEKENEMIFFYSQTFGKFSFSTLFRLVNCWKASKFRVCRYTFWSMYYVTVYYRGIKRSC